MDKFEQYKINIWEKEKNLVLEYLEKIKKFISDNNIDKELFLDIEEMVFEKLALESDINELKIRKIIKEVWQPEIIFSDYVDNKKSSSTKKEEKYLTQENFYEKLIENWWIRDNDWAILLWISKTLAEKIWISILAIRVLLILICFFWWLSAWLYILAWLILPVKWVNYSWRNTFSYFWLQIILLIRNLVYNFSAFFFKGIWFIFSKLIMILKTLYSFIVNNILPIIRFIIFWILAFCFASVLLGLMSMWAFYFSSFSIWNVDFVWVLPWYFIWWVWFWIISASILTVASFLYWVNKKVLNSYILSLAWISFVLALFLWISTWFDLAKKYIWESKINQSAQIDIKNFWTWIVNIDTSSLNDSRVSWNIWRTSWINVKASTWSIAKIEIVKTIYWNDEIRRKVEAWLNEMELQKNWNEIILKPKNNQIYKQKTPFTFFHNDIVLYLPTDKKYYINWWYYYFENVHSENKYWKYNSYLNNNCQFNVFYYSKDEKLFVCEPNESDLKYAKLEYLKYELGERFDEISTIKHVKKYKREYYGNYWVKSDWSFDNLYFWNDDKVLNIEFSDSSLDIDAQVSVEDSATWVTFKDFKVKDVEANYAFKEKYYEDISAIKDYLNEEEVSNWNY